MARQTVQYRTFPSCDGEEDSDFFAAIAFAENVYLSMHDDDDFTYSVVCPHMAKEYTNADKEVVYFCFPTIGIAVPLRPGDVLVFNPRTLHGISSRICNEDTLYCTSLYLKNKIVGGNDNSIPATRRQVELSNIK
jgi:hypothetical protein